MKNIMNLFDFGQPKSKTPKKMKLKGKKLYQKNAATSEKIKRIFSSQLMAFSDIFLHFHLDFSIFPFYLHFAINL